jgi:hypothetical protein
MFIQYILLAVLVSAGFFQTSAAEVKTDEQLYSLVFANWNYSNGWATSLQAESRFSHNNSDLETLVLKPGIYYYLLPKLEFGVGYKHINNTGKGNEQDLWQEFFYESALGKFNFLQQFRLEERFIEDVNDMVPRFRYLIHVAYPLPSGKNYLVGQNAARFNYNVSGEGPVNGFEQNRLYLGYGWHEGKYWRMEIGYMWRYQRQRNADSSSDNILRLQFLFDRDGVHPLRGGN